jgi:sterol desaturase/sphingolipid hydroxylase (fatty acid hydroxylase superfamily)
MVYIEDDMALRSVKEFRLVLSPAAGVLGIVLAAAPAAFVIARFWSPAAGWLFLLSASLFMVSYEILHLCYHAPEGSLVSRIALIRILRAHHARHHDPRLMQRYNFNVTVPLFDWIMGTMAPRERREVDAGDLQD